MFSSSGDGQTVLQIDMVEQVVVNIERMQYGTRVRAFDPAIVAAIRDILRQEFVPKE
jgi:hypothetical protein